MNRAQIVVGKKGGDGGGVLNTRTKKDAIVVSDDENTSSSSSKQKTAKSTKATGISVSSSSLSTSSSSTSTTKATGKSGKSSSLSTSSTAAAASSKKSKQKQGPKIPPNCHYNESGRIYTFAPLLEGQESFMSTYESPANMIHEFIGLNMNPFNDIPSGYPDTIIDSMEANTIISYPPLRCLCLPANACKKYKHIN